MIQTNHIKYIDDGITGLGGWEFETSCGSLNDKLKTAVKESSISTIIETTTVIKSLVSKAHDENSTGNSANIAHEICLKDPITMKLRRYLKQISNRESVPKFLHDLKEKDLIEKSVIFKLFFSHFLH